MIKAIIFDFGKVVYKTDWRCVNEIFKERNGFDILIKLDDKELVRIYNESDTGKEDYKKYFLRLGPKDQDINKSIKDYKEAYIKGKILNHGMIEIINRLREKYLLFGFTDIKKEHFDANMESGFYNGFVEIFTSFKLGMLKEDKNFFEIVCKELKRYKIYPSECIFIDDHEPNIENARDFRFKTILYKEFPDVQKFEKDLNNLLASK